MRFAARGQIAEKVVMSIGFCAPFSVPARRRGRDGKVCTSIRLDIGTHIQGSFVWRRYYKSYCSIQFTRKTCNAAVHKLPEVCGLVMRHPSKGPVQVP